MLIISSSHIRGPLSSERCVQKGVRRLSRRRYAIRSAKVGLGFARGLAKGIDPWDAAFGTVQAERTRVAELRSDVLLRSLDGRLKVLVLRDEGHPRQRLGHRIVLPQAYQAAPVEDPMAGQIQ